MTASPPPDEPVTHQLGTINFPVSFCELVDIALIHPLGYYREPVFFYIHTE